MAHGTMLLLHMKMVFYCIMLTVFLLQIITSGYGIFYLIYLFATISLAVGTNNYMQGAIDDFSLWNIALDSLQVNEFMNCPPIGNELGLVGYWNFEGEVVIQFLIKQIMEIME